jgi:hypothetical protein
MHDAGKKLTEACKKELAAFKIDLGTNLNKNIPLGKIARSQQSKPQS